MAIRSRITHQRASYGLGGASKTSVLVLLKRLQNDHFDKFVDESEHFLVDVHARIPKKQERRLAGGLDGAVPACRLARRLTGLWLPRFRRLLWLVVVAWSVRVVAHGHCLSVGIVA